MRFILAIFTLFIFSGCEKYNEPVSVSKTNNSKIHVELLFENDGCKVYRFEDYGHVRYYANCSPGVFGGHREMVGKTSRYIEDSISTSKGIK